MKAEGNKFLVLLEGKVQFILPIYQRPYSWTNEQCRQLWEDIEQVSTSTRTHFIGSIVYAEQESGLIGGIAQYLVIDGQQRLTTLALCLVALAQAIKEAGVTLQVSYEEIYGVYLINPFGKGEQRYKLLLTQSDKEALIEIIEHPERLNSSKNSSRLVENYVFFLDRIRQARTDDLNKLFQGINKLLVVQIKLGQDDNPQLIFESLNSTGMDLSQADLIRNYVLMGMKAEDQKLIYKDYWYPMEQKFQAVKDGDHFNRFFRDYLTLKQGSIPNIDRVYATFKQYQRSLTDTSIKELVSDISRYADHFLKVALLWEEDKEIRSALKDISTIKVDVVYPFLLEVYEDYVQELLSKKELLDILRLVESYLLRRLICGMPTNGLNKVFVTLARDIDKTHYLDSLQAAFLSKTGHARFPNDQEFHAQLQTKDIYNTRVCKYLLLKLENSYHGKERFTGDDLTIEHILPQNERLKPQWREELGPSWREIQTRYLHTIGNLTLTGYNFEYSDYPFSDKRDIKHGFADSPLALNKYLAGLMCWNREEIEKRARRLADRAVEVWRIPKLSGEQIVQYDKLTNLIPYEVQGPLLLPLVGFVPTGFKIVRTAERRFHLYRLVDNEWVIYSKNNKAQHAVSWHWAGEWAREKRANNEMPQGIQGKSNIVTSTKAISDDMLVESEEQIFEEHKDEEEVYA